MGWRRAPTPRSDRPAERSAAAAVPIRSLSDMKRIALVLSSCLLAACTPMGNLQPSEEVRYLTAQDLAAMAKEPTRVQAGDNIWVNADVLMTHDVCGPGTIGVFKREFGKDARVWDKNISAPTDIHSTFLFDCFSHLSNCGSIHDKTCPRRQLVPKCSRIRSRPHLLDQFCKFRRHTDCPFHIIKASPPGLYGKDRRETI